MACIQWETDWMDPQCEAFLCVLNYQKSLKMPYSVLVEIAKYPGLKICILELTLYIINQKCLKQTIYCQYLGAT